VIHANAPALSEPSTAYDVPGPLRLLKPAVVVWNGRLHPGIGALYVVLDGVFT
jgi:hypothetical protein